MPFNNHILHYLLTFSIFSYLQAAPQTTLWLSCSDDSECPTSTPEWPILCCVAPADLKSAKDLNSAKKTCRPVSYCEDTSFEKAVSIKAFAMDPSSIEIPDQSVPAQSDPAIYKYLTKAVTTLSFSDTGDFKKDCLENHNILRHLMGRTTLVWDDKLANQAQIYSKDLANRNAFEHSYKSLDPFGKLGENLYKITNGNFLPKVGILAWFNEYPLYAIGTKIGSDPVAFKEYGHFTQMQYPTLTKVGCGVAFKNKSHVFTCNYDAVQISGEILVMSIPSPRPFGL